MADASGGASGGSADPPPLTRRDAASARRAAESVEPETGPEQPQTAAQPPVRGGAVPPGTPTDPALAFQAHMRTARSEFESQVAHARAEFEEANERIKQRTGRDLILAILIALGIGAVLIGSLIFVKGVFVVFAMGVALLGLFEFARALIASGRKVDPIPQLAAGLLMMLAGYFLGAWMHWVAVFVAVAFVIVWRLVAQMVSHDGRSYGDVLADVLIAGFVQLYVPFFASLCILLVSQDGGEWWVLAFIVVAVVADTGAYAAGLTWGKHPMAPRISPKKTWEGFAGAVAASLVAGLLLGLFMLGLPWWAGIVFGAVILITATVGDLGESMIKRDLGIKDMSSWLPGHGGVLDRLDSILLSAAAALALSYLFAPLVAS